VTSDAIDLAAVVARLAAAGCVAPEAEADELVGASRDAASLERAIGRRVDGEPLEWIVGSFVFCGSRRRIEPGVYVPRSQTEELARRAAARLPTHGCALDLCCGSGAIAAHLADAAPSTVVVGIDLDPVAVRCARGNGVMAVRGDVATPIRTSARFDVITAVAPYVPTDAIAYLPTDVRSHEPRLALDGGAEGLDVVHRVVVAAAALLRRGGVLLVELGGEQDEWLAPVLDLNGFADVHTWRDEDGDLRGLSASQA
jgi:release factor glutamine methyltransferase